MGVCLYEKCNDKGKANLSEHFQPPKISYMMLFCERHLFPWVSTRPLGSSFTKIIHLRQQNLYDRGIPDVRQENVGES
jgi:hypothetical protein